MKTTIVRYKVKADRAEENKQYIRKVFEELVAKKPQGLRYVSFNLEDGLSFVHIAIVDTADGSNPLSQADAFKVFTAQIKERCDEPPAATPATMVGSYRAFGENLANA